MRSLHIYRTLGAGASTFIKRSTPVPLKLSQLVLMPQRRPQSDDAKTGRPPAGSFVAVETTRTTANASMVDLAGKLFREPMRFPLGAEIECHLGDGKWVVGTIVAHYYRQQEWPENQRVPYQVQVKESGATIYVPFDSDDCVRTTLRFPLNSAVECFLGEQLGWATGKVVKHYHCEPKWEPTEWAPYQIKLDEGQRQLPDGGGALIFAPLDEDSCVRAASNWPF